jgi:hypothetical protein
MPTDVSAGTIAVDEPSNRVWVGNCTTDWCGWVPA